MNVEISPEELRRRHKVFWKEYLRVEALRRELMLTGAKRRANHFFEHGVWLPVPVLPSWPEYPQECEGMTCGGKGRRRSGQPCQSRELYPSGRCKWHGGASTGPKSPAGKAMTATNLRQVPK
jgi:hypothetical protein